MKDYPNARDCAHGQLRRACPICEAEARLDELQEAVRKMLAAYKRAEECSCPYCMEDFERERDAVDALVGEG